MALTVVDNVGGNRHSEYSKRSQLTKLTAAVKEVQRLRQTTVAGDDVETDIPVAGIATADVLVSVINLADGTVVADAAITSAGNIQSAGTDTTGDRLLVTYFDVA
jgi:hypothetical protein